MWAEYQSSRLSRAGFSASARAFPYQLTSVECDVSVEYNGCYKAQSPPAFLGGPTMRDAEAKSVTNPLYIVYGCFNPL